MSTPHLAPPADHIMIDTNRQKYSTTMLSRQQASHPIRADNPVMTM